MRKSTSGIEVLSTEGLSNTLITALMGRDRAAVWQEHKQCADGAYRTAIYFRDRNGYAQIVIYYHQLENEDWINSRGQQGISAGNEGIQFRVVDEERRLGVGHPRLVGGE